MIGFVILFLAFMSLVVSCFVWGIHELRHPTDEGPFFVDLQRMIVERMSAFELRKNMLELKDETEGWTVLKKKDKPAWLKDLKVSGKTWLINDDAVGEVWLVSGKVKVPKNTVFDKILIVWGSFRTENNCEFKREIYAAGDCIIGKQNRLRSITTHESLVVGERTVVDGYVDANNNLYLKKGCTIGELASSKKAVFAAEDCSFGSTYSAAGLVSMADAEELIKVDRSINRQLVLCVPSQTCEYVRRRAT